MKRWFVDHAVWITGGSSGIGRATALGFASHGAKVAVSGRRTDRLQEVVDELEARGAEALAVKCDVRDDEQIEAAVRQIVERFGKLDVALANAGFSVAGRVEQLTGEDWRRQLETNVVGAALSARYALPHLRQTRGRMGFIGSVAAFLCAPKLAAYSASKFALRALGQTLAVELHGTGVSSTLVHPGYVDTEIAQVDNTGRFDPSREDRRPHQLMWPADRAAEVVVKALYRRRREVVFTGHGKVGAFLGQHLPSIAHQMFVRGLA